MTTQTTKCPNCHTVFRVGDAQLQKAEGTVRCSQCNEIFNARAFLSKAAPSELETSSNRFASSEPTLTTDSFAKALEDIQNETSANKTNSDKNEYPEIDQSKKSPFGKDSFFEDEIIKNNEIPPALKDDLISQQTPKKKHHPVFWGLCSLILISTLLLQYAYFSREELAQDPRFRPWLITLCDFLPCNIPYKKDLTQLHLLSRDVLIAPANNKDALIIQLSFINKASYIQPFPVLEIYLSDAYGKATAMRRFKPDEYLSPSVKISQGVEPNVPIGLTLELVKPEKEVSAFQIDFL